jgi:UDP-N-acetylmuramate--alanine ligase
MNFSGQVVHLIGIAGIGMSALAQLLKNFGAIVQGSDQEESYIVEILRDKNISVIIGHNSDNIKEASIVIRSTAIKDDHIEIQEALKRKIKILHRAEALELILKPYKTVAVTGTHGKSTTTAITGIICLKSGLDPIIINGAIINQISNNVHIGSGSLAIIESDESDGSFLKLPSDVGIVTNMDPEHLDYYGSTYAMEEAYKQFIAKTIKSGICIVYGDHKKLIDLAKSFYSDSIFIYGASPEADIRISNLRSTALGTKFNLGFSESFITKFNLKQDEITDIELSLFGNHNACNAASAVSAALASGANTEDIMKALKSFKGVKRRFTEVGKFNGATVIDDYAHHPLEIKATLTVAKDIIARNKKLIAVLQPHRYTRLAALLTDFADSLRCADIIIITDVYSAGESNIAGTDSLDLISLIKQYNNKVRLCTNFESVKEALSSIAEPDDMILMMGAGSITKWSYELAKIPNDLSKLAN